LYVVTCHLKIILDHDIIFCSEVVNIYRNIADSTWNKNQSVYK